MSPSDRDNEAESGQGRGEASTAPQKTPSPRSRGEGRGEGPSAADAEFMRRALFLAERARGQTSPNPLVGALIVSPDGIIVGRGYHHRAGEPHAEINALRDAGDRARGATLYCTLEPCCHTGRTGPCSVAVAQAGVRRVVAAVIDPNPRVAGGGVRYLREHGVEVTTGVMSREAARLNDVFFVNVREQRAHVTMKIAVSHDRGIALAPGVRTPLTSREANRDAQRYRAEVDAIAIGSETAIVDDPVLTVRELYRHRPLARVIFDSRLRTPSTARLFATLDAGPVIVIATIASVEAQPERVRALEDAGARVLTTADRDMQAAFATLYREAGICSVLLEGGAAIHAAAWNAGVVDRVRMYVTPDVLGPTRVPWMMPASFDLASLYDGRKVSLGRDLLLEGYVHRVD
jgi:diaminohydroxyphosphoribosylaminopyrimidine deaminase/5-amino-6-(5-phosphoribosylamino)uracil reductase